MVGAGERRLTADLARFFPTDPERVPVGIGDDAAVVHNAGRRAVVACDPVIEGVHFARGTPWALVGRKVVNRNLSDLAAMGAVPDYLLVSAMLPPGLTARARRALFGGIRAAARRAECLVVGGDVATTPGPLAVAVTAIGHPEGRVLTRSGARVGDALHVTGPLGGSLASGRHLRFRPRLEEGRWLARQRAVHAVIDISDGLLLDLWTLLRASGVPGAELDERAVPVTAAARRLGGTGGGTPLRHALTDGEDHELLFAVAPGRGLLEGGPLTDRARRPIGRATARDGLFLRRRDGTRVRLRLEGYQHDVR